MEKITLNTFKLTGRRVLVKFTEAEKKIGNIHVPETAQGKRHNGREAIVIQTGTSDESFPVEPCDTVIVHQHAGTKVEIEDHKLAIVRPEEDILAILSNIC